MLYQWKFSIIDKDGEVLRVDEIIAPTAADADFIYKHNVKSWAYDDRQLFYYQSDPQPQKLFTGEIFTVGSETLLNKIQIDCLGEVEVKLKTRNSMPVIDAPEELPDYHPIAALILKGGFKPIAKFYSTRNILGKYIYVYKTIGGLLWNMWLDSNGWQVVYYGCTSVTTIYNANDFFKLYEKIEGKPFPLIHKFPGIDQSDDTPKP